MEQCIECGKETAFTCGTCCKGFCTEHSLEVRLYLNGEATKTLADIHARGGCPKHPESLKGVDNNSTWEWRVP